MAKDDGSSDFNSARAELFEALSHPTRVKLMQALGEGAQGFSELKKRVGIESSGHMTFHLGKLNALVKTTPHGNYALTDDGKEALRLITTMDRAQVQRSDDPEARNLCKARQRMLMASLLVLIAVLGPMAAYGAYLLLQPPTIVGIVDHKTVGHGLTDGQPTAWYTVSVRLATDDPVNGLSAGETLAYIVEKDAYDRVNAGDLIKGIPRKDNGPRLELIQVTCRFLVS